MSPRYGDFIEYQSTQNAICTWAARKLSPEAERIVRFGINRFVLTIQSSVNRLCESADSIVNSSITILKTSMMSSPVLLPEPVLNSEIENKVRMLETSNGLTFANPTTHIALWAGMNMPMELVAVGRQEDGTPFTADLSHAHDTCLQDVPFSTYLQLHYLGAADECREFVMPLLHVDGAKLQLMARFVPQLATSWAGLCALAASPAGAAALNTSLPMVQITCSSLPGEKEWTTLSGAFNSQSAAPKPPPAAAAAAAGGGSSNNSGSSGTGSGGTGSGGHPLGRFHRFLTYNPSMSEPCDCYRDWFCVERHPVHGALQACDGMNLMLHHPLGEVMPPQVVASVAAQCRAFPSGSAMGEAFCFMADTGKTLAAMPWTLHHGMRRLLLQNSSVEVDYAAYFGACAPASCTYLSNDPPSLKQAAAVMVGMLGGLHSGLHLLFGLLCTPLAYLLRRSAAASKVHAIDGTPGKRQPGDAAEGDRYVAN